MPQSLALQVYKEANTKLSNDKQYFAVYGVGPTFEYCILILKHSQELLCIAWRFLKRCQRGQNWSSLFETHFRLLELKEIVKFIKKGSQS